MKPGNGRASLRLAVAALVLSACTGSTSPDASPPVSLDPKSPTLAAEGIEFDTAELTVPANRPFTLVFQNRDRLPHNVSIDTDTTGHDRRFDGDVVTGPATRWYAVPALPAGTYVFVCVLHSNMTGRLVAK
jgi:plastocyanin